MSERQMRNRNLHGFTLIELMIAVAVVGILAAIAYPSYQNSVTKSRRAEGKSLLLDAAAREERFFAQYNRYTTTLVGAASCTTNGCGLNYPPSMDNGGGTIKSANSYYVLAVVATPVANPTTFTLTATPNGTQATNDLSCPTFTLDNLGVKAAASGCW